MGSKSRSSTSRTYQTQNISQQGEAVVYGTGNRINIERADAITLDNIAKALSSGVEDITEAGTEQTRRALDAGKAQTRDTLDTARRINADSLDFGRRVVGENADLSRAVLDENADLSQTAIDKMHSLAMQVQQGAEDGSQQAMNFISSYTERDQVGNAGEATRTVMWVAAVAGVTLVGIAWASKGGLKA